MRQMYAKKKYIKCPLVCHEGKGMNIVIHKNVIIVIPFFDPFFFVSLLNAISFKHTTQASLTAQNPHISTIELQNSTSHLSKNKRKSTLSPHHAA
jgi:hypothetical protein